MGLYRILWRGVIAILAVLGAAFAVLDLSWGLLLSVSLGALVIGPMVGAAAVRGGARPAPSKTFLLPADAVAAGVVAAGVVAAGVVVAVAGLLSLAGPAALVDLAVLSVLSPTVLRRLPRSVPPATHRGARAHVGDSSVSPAPVVQGLSDADLCWRWRSSFVALQHTVLPAERVYLVEARAALLDELAHRHPEAFTGWLYSAHAASDTDPFFTDTPHDAPSSPPRRKSPE